MAERLLVMVAHPDDESFSCGGAIAACVRAGHMVRVIALSDGVGSRHREENADAAQRRVEHYDAACEHLGVPPDERKLYRAFPDQRSDQWLQLFLNREVHEQAQDYAPTCVYTHHVGDLNHDHRRVAEAVFVASRGAGWRLRTMRPEWPHLCVGPKWEPTWNIDISATMEAKVHACACYEDELRPYPHPRSLQAIRENAVESFMVIQ